MRNEPAEESGRRRVRNQLRQGYRAMAQINLRLSEEGPVFEMGARRLARRKLRTGERPAGQGEAGSA